MPQPHSHRTSWIEPTNRERALVRAGVLDTKGALDAWADWKSLGGPPDLNAREVRLAPMVYLNLKSSLIDDPGLEVFAAEATRAWAWNQLTMKALGAAIDLFNGAGVPHVLLKGTALLPLYYGNLSARKTADLDIHVQPGDFEKACALLRDAGAKAKAALGFDHQFFHALTFTDLHGREVDLHYHVLRPACWEGADEDFWEGAVSVEIVQRKTMTLCATDHLLHTCIHGRVWNQIPSLRWYSDAAIIMSRSTVDWDRLTRVATRIGVPHLLEDALRRLGTVVNADIPSHTLERLRQVPTTAAEKMWLRSLSLDRPGHPLRTIQFFVAEYLTAIRNRTFWERLRLVVSLIRYRSRTTSLWRFPATLPLRLWTLLMYRARAGNRQKRAMNAKR